MRYSMVFAVGASLAAAQLSGLPQCGQTCVSAMLQIAQSEFGCSAGDAACYCGNVNFGNGVRDCSNEACPSAEDTAAVIAYGAAYCQQALSGATTGAGPILSSAATGTPSNAGEISSAASSAAAGVTGSSVAITTSDLVGTVTSDGSTFTTVTGQTTIFSAPTGSASNSLSSVSGSLSSGLSSVSGSISSGLSSASESLSSASESIGNSISSIVNSATGGSASPTPTSTGGAAMMTAAPLMGAAALAALAML